MNTTLNANNEFKEAFSALFSKPGSPFQGANITIENLTIHMSGEPTPDKAGGTQDASLLKQTPATEVAEGLPSDLLAKKIVELNVSTIIVFSPSGGLLHAVDVEEYYEQLVASTITESLETFEVGTRFSVLYNRGPIGVDSRQWIKTAEATWTPSIASGSDDEAILIYISDKQKHAKRVKVVVESESAVDKHDVADLVMQTKQEPVAVPDTRLSSDSLAKQIAELNAMDIVITLPSGRKLHK